jgi:hypothetical protein
MGRRVPEALEVYEPPTDYALPPDDIVPHAEGCRRVEAGEATFCKHNRAIRLKNSTSRSAVRQFGSSSNSRAALGSRDAEALAGVRPMSDRQRERLIGHFEQVNQA